MLSRGAVLCMASVFLTKAASALCQGGHPLHLATSAGMLCPQVGKAWLWLDAVCPQPLPACHAAWDHLTWDTQHPVPYTSRLAA